MAAEVSADLNVINDEDVLRRMWQQTDDFGRKKEIRQRMYKLREQRLRDFYTDSDTSLTMASRKHAAPTHADSISDQSFMSLKSKEIRDSESPTRDIHRRQGDNYWNTVQQSSYSTQGGEGDRREVYERSSTGTGHSKDGATQIKLEADERGFTSSKTTEVEGGKCDTNMEQHDAQIATASHTKTDNGEAYSYSTSKEHQESKSSVTESKDGSSAFTSSRWETSSSTSSTSKKVISSSNFGRITGDVDVRAITSGDDVDFTTGFQDEVNTSTIRRTKNLSDSKAKTSTSERYTTSNRVDSSSFIDNETRNNLRNTQDTGIDIREDHFGNQDSRRGSTSTYTSEVTSNVDDYVTQDTSRTVSQDVRTEERSNVVDQKIMSEINKLDSFLSTQNTGTNTPASPRSVMGDVNWTVVSNNDGEFVYRDDKVPSSPGSKVTPIKYPDNLDLPKECTEGQYVTTYNEHYTKKISVDVSPTHDKFARSLRQTPPGTPRSQSRQSLDRSSPERKSKNSPRSSPDKERRSSVGSHTVDKSSTARRKTSEVTKQTVTSKDSSLKNKRKFSTTQTKAAAKARASTPGTSPSTSPTRKQKERSDSPSSASDSDASQVTYDKKSTSSTYTRADVVRRNLMETFDKESPAVDTKDTATSYRPNSPEKSPTRKTSAPTGILRKDSRTDSKSTITTTKSVTDTKRPTVIAPHVRDGSPEYSSEGSISKEIKNNNRKSSPDSSPDRAAFTPIKQFRTSPEMSSETIQVTTAEQDVTTVNHLIEKFITEEALNTHQNVETINITESQSVSSSPDSDVLQRRPKSPKKESPDRESPSRKEVNRRPTSQQKARTPSPGKQNREETTRKESFSKRPSISRAKSPQKDENSRPRSPTKTTRKPSLPQRSPSPQKERVRSVSPSKGVSAPRKPSLPARSPSPDKRESSRSPSPKKESISSTTITTVTRRSSLKKDTSYNVPPSTRKSSRQETPSPVKDVLKSRSPSPKKQSPQQRSPSPEKSKSPSPRRGSIKRTRQQQSSPSVSPCSSPERPSENKQDRSKSTRKMSGPKSPDREFTRTSRRSSIPRADQPSAVRKVVQTKIEIRSKPTSRIPASTNKAKPGQTPFKNVRTDSQNSLDKHSTTRTYSSTTTIRKTVEKAKEPIKKTVAPKRTVTTTAVISLQKPTVTSQVRQSTSSTVSKATTYKRTPSKEITTTKVGTPTDKKPMVTTTTKRVASRTNTPKSKPLPNQEETDRSSIVSSPEPIISDKVKSEAFIQQLRKDEIAIHGFKDETINLELTDNDLENEPRPECFPETEDDEDVVNQNENITEENTHHVTEKTINIDSNRKVASQFIVTIKKPTAVTSAKTPTKPVTSRSSSGPVRGTPQASPKTVPVKGTTNKRQTPNTVQKAESLNLIRTTSDKNVQKRQTSKSDISTTKSTQPTKVTSSKQVTETGIASRNVTTAKSATMKRVVPVKKKPVDSVPSSSSEDEPENVPSVVTPNQQEQQYIEELEEMRRNEELEYASKLTATTNQENQLLSVIVQHPKSSRESSPDYSNRSQPFCTVSDDGGSAPRYADLISEPEDVEVFDPKPTPKFDNFIQKQPKFEQVTDLDEESEAEDVKLNVSVADRVTHFIETSKAHTASPVREEAEPQTPVDSPKNVLKAKAMFETIARNQTSVPAPNNKPVDILSRPSIFEARRGQTAPKPVYADTFPRMKSPENVQRRGSIHVDYQQEQVETIDYEESQVEVNELTSQRVQTPSPVREAPESVTKPQKMEPPLTVKSPIVKKEPTAPVKLPEQYPKADPTSRSVKKDPIPTFDKKRPDNVSKPKPFEKTISASAEVSSKRAFFERKVQAQTSPSKDTKPYSPNKGRKPLTESIQNKENIRGPSPPRKTSQTTTFIESERKSSRVSPERKISSPSPTKERKPSMKSESPERKISSPSPVKERKPSTKSESPERKFSSPSPSKERKPSMKAESPERKISSPSPVKERKPSTKSESPERKFSSPSPAKERKPSLKSESPERKISLSKSVKERRTSFTKEDVTTHHVATVQKKDSFSKTTERKTSPSRASPERRAPITLKNFPDHVSKSPFKDTPEQMTPSSPVKDRRPSFSTAKSPERVPQRKSSRSSPDRSVQSPERTSPKEVEPVELNKAGKFGVTLRRTSSTTSAGTPRRPSIPGETQEIEDVTDLSLLEIMMEKAVGYEQRRRIRAQIRIVKRNHDDRARTPRHKSPTRSPTRDYKEPATRTPDKRTEKRASSPTKNFQERVTEQRSTTRRTTTATTTAKPTTTTTTTVEQTHKVVREPSPLDKPLTNGYHSPDRSSPALRTTSPQRKESLPDRRSPASVTSRPDTQVRRSSKTEAVEVTTTSVKSQKRTETLVESGVDCITSSYGVGPTDEKGRPLFGLRALRRTNTNKQLTDEVEVRREQEHPEVQEPVCDAKGRPLFGGLKALRVQETVEATMPEQTSTQLRELVERHEKVVRETNGPQDQPRQKPKAKLRDSFILQEEEQSGQGHLAEVNSLNRGLSLRSIIQKHENIANIAGTVRSEMESSHTVVTSRSTVSSDGSVSLNRDVIQGELSAKNGEEPVGKVTRTQYSYQSPHGDDEGVNKVTTTTTTLGRRTSGPKITEIEDVHEVSGRKSSLKSSKEVEEVTGRRSAERVTNRKGSLQKSSSEDDEQRKNERFSSQEEDEEVQTISRVSSSSQRYTSSTDSAKKTSSTPTRQTKTSSPSLRRQRSSEEDSAEDKRKAVVRGDSVRALQHKFQQATENAANSTPLRSQAPRAGLILRTASFTTADQQESVSSTLKQSTALSADKRSGRQSPDKRRDSLSDANTTSRQSPSSDSKRDSITETSRRESVKTSGDSTVTRVTETRTTTQGSFLDNTSRVTGVQDILSRMRNADLVSESEDTDADREARALLNKFLGASVILQGMEQGMRAGTMPDVTPGSAALVSSVEKQRVATTRQKEEDIENIWDEQVLKALLEQCTDYDGRRKLRARLRTVMAEHKACADLVAVTGGSSAANVSETETTQVSTKTQDGSVTRTEVHTRTSTNRLTKASSVASSPFAKFKQLERQNSAPSAGAAPLFKITDARVARSASSIKDRLLSWVQAQTREYKNIQIDNFSTSWNNGLAFCALIHHFCPDAFDYDKLTADQRRHNFELAFRVAEEEAGIAPLLDVEDMVVMRRPDWKCVFTYVQSVYRRFHSTPEAVRC